MQQRQNIPSWKTIFQPSTYFLFVEIANRYIKSDGRDITYEKCN